MLGAQSKDGKYSGDKANIGNPKVNSGCPPLTANRTWTDCDQNSPGPSIQYIPLGVYHTGGFNAIICTEPDATVQSAISNGHYQYDFYQPYFPARRNVQEIFQMV